MCSIHILASQFTSHSPHCHSPPLWFLLQHFCSVTPVLAAWPAHGLSDSWMERVEAWVEVELVVLWHYWLRDEVEVRVMCWRSTGAVERVMLSQRFCWCLSIDLPTFFLRPRTNLHYKGDLTLELTNLSGIIAPIILNEQCKYLKLTSSCTWMVWKSFLCFSVFCWSEWASFWSMLPFEAILSRSRSVGFSFTASFSETRQFVPLVWTCEYISSDI